VSCSRNSSPFTLCHFHQCFVLITGELLKEFTSVLACTASPTAESDEVDILGYGSNQSDTDDHSSIQSSASDGGVTISTRRLTITENPTHDL
ncbi:Max-interacting protein 1, partial [Halocaridina rubra]